MKSSLLSDPCFNLILIFSMISYVQHFSSETTTGLANFPGVQPAQQN
jgi:hypothetical protein